MYDLWSFGGQPSPIDEGPAFTRRTLVALQWSFLKRMGGRGCSRLSGASTSSVGSTLSQKHESDNEIWFKSF